MLFLWVYQQYFISSRFKNLQHSVICFFFFVHSVCALCAAYFCSVLFDFVRYEFCLLRQYYDRCFILSIASSFDTTHTCLSSVLCGCMVFCTMYFYSSHRHWKDLISLSPFSPPPLPLFVYCLSFLCPLPAGDVLFQMAEVHRQIQIQLEEMVSMWWWCC